MEAVAAAAAEGDSPVLARAAANARWYNSTALAGFLVDCDTRACTIPRQKPVHITDAHPDASAAASNGAMASAGA